MMVIVSLLKTFYNRIRKPHPAVLFFREQVVFGTSRSENPTCSRAKECRLPSRHKRIGSARDNARFHVFQGFAAGLGQVTPHEHGDQHVHHHEPEE